MAEQKIREISHELKKAGLWKQQMPNWVTDYSEKIILNENDFVEWLQFIYLPNCLSATVTGKRTHIVPQAMRFFGEDLGKGKLLQLLIELDGTI